MKDWGKAYFDMMDGILAKHGLPKELKYLAVIESQLEIMQDPGQVLWVPGSLCRLPPVTWD